MIRFDLPAAGGQRERLGPGRHVDQAGRVMQVQVEELPEDHLGQLPVLLQDELVVQARDQDDVLDPLGHQDLEVLEAAAAAEDRETVVEVGHGHLTVGATPVR